MRRRTSSSSATIIARLVCSIALPSRQTQLRSAVSSLDHFCFVILSPILALISSIRSRIFRSASPDCPLRRESFGGGFDWCFCSKGRRTRTSPPASVRVAVSRRAPGTRTQTPFCGIERVSSQRSALSSVRRSDRKPDHTWSHLSFKLFSSAAEVPAWTPLSWPAEYVQRRRDAASTSASRTNASGLSLTTATAEQISSTLRRKTRQKSNKVGIDILTWLDSN